VSGQHDIRLFLADVDGALVTKDKVLTEAAKAAVRELDHAGIAFAITSGRPPRGMSMLIEPLALRTAIAGFNGGVLVNPDLSVIESRTLDPAAAKQTLKLILGQGLDAWVYTEDEWLIRDKEAPHVAREAWTVIIMGHILHDWDVSQKKMLLSKAFAAVPNEGAVIVYDAIIDDERRENAFGLLMSLNMLIETPNGSDYTGADCQQWMRESGFSKTQVEHLVGPDSMVIGLK
jgi:hydroxymethylpyrimidine pyrophosphatase-like HAD family hydrolase